MHIDIPTVTALVGIGIAIWGLKYSHQASRSAQQAVTTAKQANALCADANQLAADANALSERALSAAREKVAYKWGLNVDEQGVLTIVNESPYTAVNTVLVAVCNGLDISPEGEVDVPALGKVEVDLGGLFTQAVQDVLESVPETDDFGDCPIRLGHGLVKLELRVALSFESPGGNYLGCVVCDVVEVKALPGGEGFVAYLVGGGAFS